MIHQDYSDLSASKELINVDLSVPLMYQDPSDLDGSLIQIQVTPKERTLTQERFYNLQRVPKWENGE